MLVYLTDPTLSPEWTKVYASLEEVFQKDGELRQFSLYRDEKRDVRHNVYHPIDYVSHDVRIIIGEFDTKEHLKECRPDNSKVVKELDREGNTSIMKVKFPIMQDKKFKCDEYTYELFENISNDDRILFCYITTSGKGIRFGFKLNERVNNDLEYISNYYFYGKEFLKHDKENRFGLESTSSSTGSFYELCSVSSVYWLLPTSSAWTVKDSIEVQKL